MLYLLVTSGNRSIHYLIYLEVLCRELGVVSDFDIIVVHYSFFFTLNVFTSKNNDFKSLYSEKILFRVQEQENNKTVSVLHHSKLG